MAADPLEYLDLEVLLTRKLQKEWAKDAKRWSAALRSAIEAEDWDSAYKVAHAIDMSGAAERSRSFAYSVYRGAIDLGASLAADGDPLTSSLAFDDTLASMLTQLSTYLEWSATAQAQRSALQSIALAREPKEVVVKAEPLRPFVSFQENGDANLQLISALHTNRLGSWGFIAECDLRGISTYKLTAMLDNRTSEFCRLINGLEFQIEDARGLVELAVHTDNPDDLKALHPWPKQDKESIKAYKTMSTVELVANKLHVPPFHPGCRTIMVRTNKPARIEKPVVQEPLIPEFLSTKETFTDVGISITDKQLAVWNDYVKLHPVDVHSALTGKPNTQLLEEGMKGAVKISAAKTTVKLDWKLKDKGYDFQGRLVYQPTDGTLTIDKMAFKKVPQDQLEGELKRMFKAFLDLGKSLGAVKLASGVAQGHAASMAALGFVPTAVEWAAIRLELLELVMGGLNAEFLALTQVQRVAILDILNSKNAYGLAALTDLSLPESFLSKLLAATSYRGELDLADAAMVARFQSQL